MIWFVMGSSVQPVSDFGSGGGSADLLHETAEHYANEYVRRHSLTGVTVERGTLCGLEDNQYETYSVTRTDPMFLGAVICRFVVTGDRNPPKLSLPL
jgi:hypothetical protein